MYPDIKFRVVAYVIKTGAWPHYADMNMKEILHEILKTIKKKKKQYSE